MTTMRVYSLVNNIRLLLGKKIDLLSELYAVDIIPEKVWIWCDYKDPMMYTCIINDMEGFPLQISVPIDAELIDYVAFCVVMACKPKKQPDELITYYALKYGYKLL